MRRATIRNEGRPTTHRRLRTRDRGAVLFTALVVILLVSAFVGGLVLSTNESTQDQRTHEDGRRAFQAAEAGLARSLAEINSGFDADGDGLGTIAGAQGRGTYAVTSVPTANGFDLVSLATTPLARQTIRQSVSLLPGPFRGAFLSGSSSSFSGVTIDSYDSSLGSYASQITGFDPNLGRDVARSNGDVGSLGDLYIEGSTGILGDVRPGLGGSVTFGAGSWYVSGDIMPFGDPPALDPYVYAPTIASSGNLIVGGQQTVTVTTGTYRYGRVQLTGQAKLVFDGDIVIYVDGDFDVGGGAEVRILLGSSLTIHQGDGLVNVAGNGIVNETSDPLSLSWYSASTQTIKLSGTSAFHGNLYAPYADIVVTGGVEGYGALVGDTIDAGGSSVWHYDEALMYLQPFQTPTYVPLLYSLP